jgi:hypothetical protein
MRSGGLDDDVQPPAGPGAATSEPTSERPQPSAARRLAAQRQRAREEVIRGRIQAMRTGIYARVANLPDVALEVERQLALRPALDQLRDLRLVESFAMASVQLRRAHEAIETQGLTEHLGAFLGKHGPLVERLERSLHEREQERQASSRKAGSTGLAAFAPPVRGQTR